MHIFIGSTINLICRQPVDKDIENGNLFDRPDCYELSCTCFIEMDAGNLIRNIKYILSSNWFDRKSGIIGIVVYTIEPGPILKGKYAVFPGDGSIKMETLTFKKGLIPSDNASENRLKI